MASFIAPQGIGHSRLLAGTGARITGCFGVLSLGLLLCSIAQADITQTPRPMVEQAAVGEPEQPPPAQKAESQPRAAESPSEADGATPSGPKTEAAPGAAADSPRGTGSSPTEGSTTSPALGSTSVGAATTGPSSSDETGTAVAGAPRVVRVESVRAEAAPVAPATPPAPADCPAPPKPAFTSLLLIEGTAKYGGLVEGPDLNDDSAPTTSSRAGQLGVQATLGFMPGGKAFTMGGRLSGGMYLGSDIMSGSIGASVLFGANFARQPDGRTFSYALGGFGLEYIPGVNQDILTLHVSGGTVVRGINFGADIDLGGNDEFARFMFGMHMGWGRLF